MNSLRSTLLRRILREQRALVIPVIVLIVLNIAVYAAVIYPLSRSVSDVSERTQAAESELASARLAHARAVSALNGKSEAVRALDHFYTKVLPVDLAAVRKMIFPRLDQLARQTHLKAKSSTVERVSDTKRTLRQLKIQMELTGEYSSIRDYIHRLERGSEFLVIDRVVVRDGAADMAPLTLMLDLSTFYKGVGK